MPDVSRSQPAVRGVLRRPWMVFLVTLGLSPWLTWGFEVSAQERGRIAARLLCPARTGEGRIVCELTVTAPEGRLLTWSDALVVEAPEFAPPLRERVVAQLPEEGASRVVLALPLLATAENTGTLRVRARAVSCPRTRDAACTTSSRLVTAPVAVKGAPGGNLGSWPTQAGPDRRGKHATAWPPPGHDPG